MKAEHRHELKTNELAQWITEFPQWVKTNSRMIIYVAIVIVAVVGTVLLKSYNKQQVYKTKDYFTSLISRLNNAEAQIIQAASQGEDMSFQLLGLADDLQTAAETFTDPVMISLAYIKRGDTLRSELHYRQMCPSAEVVTEQIDKALAAYNNALSKGSDKSMYVAGAKFGLGICAEEKQNFDGARAIYNEIVANEEFKGTVAYASAAGRLEIMDKYTSAVEFKAAPAAVQPAERELKPQIQLKAPAEGPLQVPTEGPVAAPAESNKP